MTGSINKLDREDRDFFCLLAEIIFSNPFSFDSAQLRKKLGIEKEFNSDEHYYAAVIPKLDKRLIKLAENGIDSINKLQGQDREILEYAYLFKTYHQYVTSFDQHIQKQIVSGSKPVKVEFSNKLLSNLMQVGFSEDEACRYLALFFQIRRAYYFIDDGLVGDASCMRQLRHALWNNVFTTDMRMYANHLWNRMEDFSTLILGETGTGKGAAAAAIGRSGLIPFDKEKSCFKYSFTQTFISINLSEFSENLIESELFGHRKGAFTGAVDNYKGLFERCNPHGSLLLDEIGDISTTTQIKLLNVLQSRDFKPVGSHEEKRFQGRIIAATNRCLEQRRNDGQFRDDFYYRLSSDVIKVPSLYQRLQESQNELRQLVSLLIKRLTGGAVNKLQDRVMKAIENDIPDDYKWPGNVRELEQAVRRILLNGEYKVDISSEGKREEWICKLEQAELSAQDLLAKYCKMVYAKHKTYEKVASITGLDRRTAKKYIQINS